MQKTLAKLFDVHPNTVGNWKKEGRLSFLFFQKYFKKEEIEEFIETGKIEKLETLDIHFMFIKAFEKLLSSFVQNLDDIYSFLNAIQEANRVIPTIQTATASRKLFLAIIKESWSNTYFLYDLPLKLEESLIEWLFEQNKTDYEIIKNMKSLPDCISLFLLLHDANKKNINRSQLLKELHGCQISAWGCPLSQQQTEQLRSFIKDY